jgi:hypothetical protein
MKAYLLLKLPQLPLDEEIPQNGKIDIPASIHHFEVLAAELSESA